MYKYCRKGFTLIEIVIVLAIVAVILAIALPNYLTSGSKSKKTICINNLKLIDAAIDQWAMENNIPDGADPSDDIYSYIKGKKPECPSGGEYTLYPVGSKPQVRCSLEDAEDHRLPE
jgi:prepilin-type N-terminal cleavage/methylation domain-containing protein